MGLRVDASAATGFDDREEDGASLSGFSFADEQPVLFTDGSWPDGSLHRVVVDLDSAVFEIDDEHGPKRQGVVNGSAHGALGQMLSFEFDPGEHTVDAVDDHAALAGCHGLSLLGSGFGLAQLFFDAVDMLDLQKHPPGLLRCALRGFVEPSAARQTADRLPVGVSMNQLAPRMGPACGQGDAPFAAISERGIGGVTIALHRALEVGGGDVVQTSRCSTGGPGEADVGSGSFAGPKVALFSLAVAGTQILHWGLIDLHITSGHDAAHRAFVANAHTQGVEEYEWIHLFNERFATR